MKHLIYISLFLISNLVFCQNKKLNNPSKPGDTTRWDKQIGLNDIKQSEYNWYFRLYTDKQVIDVWEDTSGKTFGEITCWAQEHSSNYKKPSNSIFSGKSILNSMQLSKVISLINSSQIYAIPDQDSIKGWERGFDGITYTIEHKIKTDYAIKSYWTPTAQGTLSEAILVQNFVDGVLKAVAAKEAWEAFASRIPFTCYINGGPMITCKIQNREAW